MIELPRLDAQEDAASIAKLAEIAENLHRREITALERSELQAAWVEIVEARKRDAQSAELRPIEKKQRADGKGHRKPSGINQAARDLGIPRSTLQQSVRIAKLSPEAKAEAKKLKLDNNQDALCLTLLPRCSRRTRILFSPSMMRLATSAGKISSSPRAMRALTAS